MTLRGLQKAFDSIQETLASDGQLLASFIAARDEGAFAALVHRHGRMVFGVCRRILRHTEDAEDAFQGTFLILARKAGSVLNRESVAGWLYHVAYRTALEAQGIRLRRRLRERQVKDMPHAEVVPHEAQDWRPLLDRELSCLSEKYREALVLCDLEGRSRKEAAKILRIPEGTLSSRLAAARRLLARKLSRHGLAVSGGALATALAAEAPAAVPKALGVQTVKAGLLVAAGQLTAVSSSAVLLMKEVLKTMVLKKLIFVGLAGLLAVVFGASSYSYRAADDGGQRQAGKPTSELEALRRENELLRFNLLLLLEKVRAQESELLALKGKPATNKILRAEALDIGKAPAQPAGKVLNRESVLVQPNAQQLLENTPRWSVQPIEAADRIKEIKKVLEAARVATGQKEPEAKVKGGGRAAPDSETLDRVIQALDEAVKELKKAAAKQPGAAATPDSWKRTPGNGFREDGRRLPTKP